MNSPVYDGPTYTKVRNDFLERRDLSAVEKLILAWLHGRFRSDGQPWDVNADQIRVALNLGYDATDKALSKLKAKGWLTDNRTDRDAEGHRVKSVVIESRRGEVIAPDMAPIPGRESPTRDAPEVATKEPGRESPTWASTSDDTEHESPGRETPIGISRSGKPDSNEGLSHEGQSNARAIEHYMNVEGNVDRGERVVCSCGKKAPWRPYGDDLREQLKADKQDHLNYENHVAA